MITKKYTHYIPSPEKKIRNRRLVLQFRSPHCWRLSSAASWTFSTKTNPRTTEKLYNLGRLTKPRLVVPVTVLWIPNQLESLLLFRQLAMGSSRNTSLTILDAVASASPCSLTSCSQAELGSRSPKRPHNRLTRWRRIDFDNVWILTWNQRSDEI